MPNCCDMVTAKIHPHCIFFSSFLILGAALFISVYEIKISCDQKKTSNQVNIYPLHSITQLRPCGTLDFPWLSRHDLSLFFHPNNKHFVVVHNSWKKKNDPTGRTRSWLSFFSLSFLRFSFRVSPTHSFALSGKAEDNLGCSFHQ